MLGPTAAGTAVADHDAVVLAGLRPLLLPGSTPIAAVSTDTAPVTMRARLRREQRAILTPGRGEPTVGSTTEAAPLGWSTRERKDSTQAELAITGARHAQRAGARFTAQDTERHAKEEDDSRFRGRVAGVCACLASLVGVAFDLVKVSQTDGYRKIAPTAAAVLTVVLSWAVVHTVFALQYAREYYSGTRAASTSIPPWIPTTETSRTRPSPSA